jgi:ATP-dependent RNA helicase RhlE
MSFSELGLSPELLQAVAAQGYDTPTPIQQQAIPVILAGRDVLAGAQTGTGKTAGFTLPILQLLAAKPSEQKHRPVRALILTPTRELAMQVYESVQTYGKYSSLTCEVIFGGVNVKSQIKRLHQGADIIVATPGRLLDLVNQRQLHLSHVEFFVLDEADRMLDMGFIGDIRKVMALLPKKRQNLLFSATFANEIKDLAQQLLKQPAQIQVTPVNSTVDAIAQLVYPIKQEYKRELLSYLIGSNNWKQVLVFVRTKHGADRLCKQLMADGIRCAALHGNKSQGARVTALEDFKNGKITTLVATDIAARGLDIDQLPHVINFDMPYVAEDYVHRIGRTGRAGREGAAISLVTQDEAKLLFAIERLLKQDIPRVADTGYEKVTLVASSSPAKVDDRPRRHQNHGKKPTQVGDHPVSRQRVNNVARNRNGAAKSGGRRKG